MLSSLGMKPNSYTLLEEVSLFFLAFNRSPILVDN
jgi:hypothetical protein